MIQLEILKNMRDDLTTILIIIIVAMHVFYGEGYQGERWSQDRTRCRMQAAGRLHECSI